MFTWEKKGAKGKRKEKYKIHMRQRWVKGAYLLKQHLLLRQFVHALQCVRRCHSTGRLQHVTTMIQTTRYRDMSVELSTFLLKNIGIWTAENPAEERRRKIMFAYTTIIALLSILVESRELYFAWLYKGDILYVITNVFTLTLALIKVSMIRIHKQEFTDMIMYIREKFLNVSYESHENKIVSDCRRICTIFVCCVTTIGLCVMMSYIAAPYVGRSGNDTQRILPFNMWINFVPMSESPYYEVALATEVFGLYFVGMCYFCFDNIFCIMAIHLSGQFRVLQYRFKKLCDMEYQVCEKDRELMLINHIDKSYQKFKTYVRQHQSLIRCCDRLENIYTMIILGQVLVSSALICLFGYQILVAEATAVRRSIFVFLLIGSMSLLFMFTYSCDCVIEQSDKVAIGAYSALWTIMPMNKSGKMLRNDLILVIGRSRRVCCLTANGFFPVSLETYTTILSTAVSYFTLLRNRVEETNAT